ncbi:MAG: polyhydroxyalkanoic acid system family protein [Candidatus Pacearchaeota archaeon]|nr:polyhydroxyalkanoic acid system family protein [Candidatus Pacearchaeota archaeon]
MEIKYNLGNYSQEEAYQKVDAFLDGLVKQHSDLVSNPSKKWNPEKNKMDFGFEAKGYTISGNIKLQGKELVLDGKLPWVAKMFSGKIEDMVLKQLGELFPKKK